MIIRESILAFCPLWNSKKVIVVDGFKIMSLVIFNDNVFADYKLFSWNVVRFLTLQDAHYEEQMATVVDKMLLQVHMLGEGCASFSVILIILLNSSILVPRNSFARSSFLNHFIHKLIKLERTPACLILTFLFIM